MKQPELSNKAIQKTKRPTITRPELIEVVVPVALCYVVAMPLSEVPQALVVSAALVGLTMALPLHWFKRVHLVFGHYCACVVITTLLAFAITHDTPANHALGEWWGVYETRLLSIMLIGMISGVLAQMEHKRIIQR